MRKVLSKTPKNKTSRKCKQIAAPVGKPRNNGPGTSNQRFADEVIMR